MKQESWIQLRAPVALTRALEQEAERRAISMSRLVRLAVAKEIGWMDDGRPTPTPTPIGDQAEAAQEVRRCE